MKSFFNLLCILLIGISLQSCEKATAEDTLRQAEAALQSGKIELALSNCNLLSDSTSVDLSSTQMCRLAIVYARLSEIADNQDYMATATRCFESAVNLDQNIDSLETYIASLDVESQGVVRVIREVVHALNSPCEYSASTSDEEEEEYVEHMENPTSPQNS